MNKRHETVVTVDRSEVRRSVPLALSMLTELERHCIEIWRSRQIERMEGGDR
jgi:hypothetical protein